MKTEPTEAFRAMANDLKYNVGVIHSNPQLILEESFISGVRYGQSSPKIKQLEWMVEFHNNRYIGDKEVEIQGETAKTDIGSYEMFEQDGKFLLYTIVGCLYEFETKEEAKEFAQDDFEKMVMECIETK